jgi:lipoprotein-anchoring transpeptidase ErfK/SrfK
MRSICVECKKGRFILKKSLRQLVSILCAGSLFIGSAMAATMDSFSDVAGHWAYPELKQAVDNGMLQGDNGRLNPGGSLTTAQMTAILNRMLGAVNTSRAYPDTPEGQWYTEDAKKGASLGILPTDGTLKLEANVTRAQAFQALAAAFGLEEAEPNESVLNSFSDAYRLTPAQRRAVAVLVRDGIIAGSENGTLDGSRGITRAEFISLVYRILNGTYVSAFTTATKEPEPEAPAAEPAEDESQNQSDAQNPDEGNENDKNEEKPQGIAPVFAENDAEDENQKIDNPISDDADTSDKQEDADKDTDTSDKQDDADKDADTSDKQDDADKDADTPDKQDDADKDTDTSDKQDNADKKDNSDENGTVDTPNVPQNPTTPPPANVLLYTVSPLRTSYNPDGANRVVLRGDNMGQVFPVNTPVSIQRLVIAMTGQDFELNDRNGSKFDAIAIGGGTHKVTLAGEITHKVEITGSSRVVDLRGMSLDSLVISGVGNTITVDNATSIRNLKVLKGAIYNHITVDGDVNTASFAGNYTTATGSGRTNSTEITGKYCSNTLPSDNLNDRSDIGLDKVTLSLNSPTVAAGGQLAATVTINGLDKTRVCAAQWYYDGQPDAAFANSAMSVSEGSTSVYSHEITFAKQMVLEHTVGFQLTYQNPATGDTEIRSVENKVAVQNYPASHYLPDASEVLAKISSTFRGVGNDYTQNEKTVFVNAKGYSSPTQYLIWVSRYAQKVNVFEGSQYNWKLIHEFACATGASGSATPVGVTYVTYKQSDWTTSSYTCRPIVRFYPGTGYAFHSRLYYPRSNRLKDGTMGRPASHGCVRMMDEGIYWLYNNVPSKTTVVIF